MQAIKQPSSKDKLVFIGIIFLILFFTVFIIPDFMILDTAEDPEFGIFFANYLLAFIYGLILLIKGGYSFGWRIFRNDVEPSMISLILFMISAFSLNRGIAVFEESASWVSAYIWNGAGNR